MSILFYIEKKIRKGLCFLEAFWTEEKVFLTMGVYIEENGGVGDLSVLKTRKNSSVASW